MSVIKIHKIIIFVLFSIIILLLSGCGENNDESSSSTKNVRIVQETTLIKKTLQIQSYDENGDIVLNDSIKDDGYYQKGLEPRYTRTSEIVIDDLTSLMWQDNSEITTILKSYLNDENFALCDANRSSQSCSNTVGDTATTYCSELTLGGYSDWRLPSIYELSDLIDTTEKPTINEIFKNTTTDQYISSTSYTSEIFHNLIWGVHFYFGSISDYANNHKIRVRCVRDDNIQANNSNKIELEWQDNEISPALRWKDAINYCEELNLKGMGWRLANINELKSIIDYSKNNPSIKSSFLNTTPLNYWSSSTDNTNKNSAWTISFRNGSTANPVKTGKYYTRCVR